MQQASSGTASPLERRIDLSFSMKQIETEIESRLKRIARTAKLPGFRPGKVPLKIVAQQYGGQGPQKDFGDQVQKGFLDAGYQQNFSVAGFPRFEAKKHMACV